MKTRCPRCKSDMDNTTYVKKYNALVCSECGHLLRMEVITHAKSAMKRGERNEVPLPKGITATRDDEKLVLRRRWFTKSALVLALFTILWDGAIAIWYTSLFGLDGVKAGFYSLSPIMHILTGIILTWYTLAALFDKTTIEVTHSRVEVSSGPFRWFGNFTIEADELEQLWSQKMAKTPDAPLYHVLGSTRSGRAPFIWLYGLENPAQALFIEQEIEKYLGIEDRAVKGELR